VERRFTAHAGARALIALVLVGGAASAAPSGPEAKSLFDRGLAAYSAGDYAAAEASLSKSLALESDVETLFALAQTERKLERCDKAIELYQRLLAMSLPDANKQAVDKLLGECKAILAAHPEPPPPASPVVATAPEQPAPEQPAPLEAQPAPPAPEGRSWYRDPVGDTLVGVGVVGLGVGTAMMLSARSADDAKKTAPTYQAYQHDLSTAHDRGEDGVIGLAAGGAFVITGVVWYVTHRAHPAVTAWLAPTGGGVAFGGGF